MRAKYAGPFPDGVRLPAIDTVVLPGESVAVDEATARGLLGQPDWEVTGLPEAAESQTTEEGEQTGG